MRDEELRSSRDYNEGQKEAAHRILIELVNLFDEYRDDTKYHYGYRVHHEIKDECRCGDACRDPVCDHEVCRCRLASCC